MWTGDAEDLVARPPVCIAVHAVFADGAYDELLRAGPARVGTFNTIPHVSNAIDVMPALGAAMRNLDTPVC